MFFVSTTDEYFFLNHNFDKNNNINFTKFQNTCLNTFGIGQKNKEMELIQIMYFQTIVVSWHRNR